jgi:hypothetical protein
VWNLWRAGEEKVSVVEETPKVGLIKMIDKDKA